MEREIITLSEFDIAPILYEYAIEEKEYDEYYDDESGEIIGNPIWNQFEAVKEAVEYYDLEKCYENRSVIVQRKSDGKFFRGGYTYAPYAYCGNSYDTTLTEVFPVQVLTTKYE